MEDKTTPYGDQEAFTPEPPARRPRGCLFYGCLTVAILALIAIILVGTGAYLGYRAVEEFVQEYADDVGKPVPVVELPAEEVEAVQERIKKFRDALAAGKATDPLVLTADEVNSLIAEQPWLPGKLALEFAGDKVRGQVSIPLESLGFPANVLFPGKFLNGNAEFSVGLDGDQLVVKLESLEVKGKHVPDNYVATFRAENLARGANTPANAKHVARLKSIEIKDGKLIISPKPQPEAPGPAPAKDGQ
jgi:hypothetical protein